MSTPRHNLTHSELLRLPDWERAKWRFPLEGGVFLSHGADFGTLYFEHEADRDAFKEVWRLFVVWPADQAPAQEEV